MQRLRAESNALQKEILSLEAEQRQLEQAKHNQEQNLQKLDQLGQNIAGAQASAQDNCNTPNPSPSPSPSSSHDPYDGPYGTPDKITEGTARKYKKESGKNGKEIFDPEAIKKDIYGNNGSKYDLYIDELNNIYVAPKPQGGKFPSHYEFSGENLSNFI